MYLNAQFKASLLELDDNGALMVADYKMKVIRKSARETKEEFFGEFGWTLHTILVFQNSSNGNLDIQAYDHWSEDIKMLGSALMLYLQQWNGDQNGLKSYLIMELTITIHNYDTYSTLV